MRPSVVKRLQILGVYRDVELSTPNAPKTDPLKSAEKAQQGVSEDASNPLDRDREIYECYCELDVQGFEHKKAGKPTGLEIPYRVTLDVTSREILSIVRNFDEDTADLPEPRKVFVKYPYVPGFGFYDIGLLHILGNTTNAVTAAWREMLDNGMFANFPGFLIAKASTRQQSNIVRVAPGSGQPVDINGMPSIRDAVMPLPYETSGMPALMSLVEDITANGQRLGGTAEANVGEGRQDAPVGTTLALIEQATKIENAVHKRLHAAQAEEFQLLVQCFREHPQSFWQRPGRSGYPWDEATFLKAISDYNLVPQADPNTASHTQRLMKAMALAQAARQAPQIFNPLKVAETALRAMGWENPQQYLNPTPQPDPKAIQAQSAAQTDQIKAQAASKTADARLMDAKTNASQGLAQSPQPDPLDAIKARASLMDARTREASLSLDARRDAIEDHNRDLDRAADAHEAVLDLAKTLITHPANPEQVGSELKPIEADAGLKDQ